MPVQVGGSWGLSWAKDNAAVTEGKKKKNIV